MRTLSSQEIDFFHTEGYAIVNDVFQPGDIDCVCHEMHVQISNLVEEMVMAGIIPADMRRHSFLQQLARVFESSPEAGKRIIAALEGRAGGGYKGEAFFSLITNPRLLHLVRGLIGDEIVASSAYRIRPKLPGQARGVVPWHQDSGYFDPICDEHLILTCWIPLVDANLHNGCLQILPRSHRQGLFPHFSGGNADFLVIPDDRLPVATSTPVTAECLRGGVVLLSNLTPHCSTWNYSDQIRWSIDLRFQQPSSPNNLALSPKIDSQGADVNVSESYQMACYPPEADFLVSSASMPEAVVDFAAFCDRREAFERASALPRPRRSWPPLLRHDITN